MDLIGRLRELYNRLEKKGDTESVGTQTDRTRCDNSLICALPARILHEVFLFLDFFADIPALTETCTFFHSEINSRSFQVKIYKLRSRNRSMPSQKESEIPIHVGSLPDAVTQLKKSSALNNFLMSKVGTQDKKIEELNKTIHGINDEIRIQKQINNKTLGRVSFYQSDIEKAVLSEKETRFDLEKSNQQCIVQIDKLENSLNDLTAERDKLIVHKKALRTEVLKLRREHQFRLKELGRYRDTVYKMKSYFETMIVPKIEEN